MKNHFDTREEAEKYKQDHELFIMTVEYIPCFEKWALVFPLKAYITPVCK
jgi:hypothetical protein